MSEEPLTAARSQPLIWRTIPVPHIVPWEGELADLPRLTLRSDGMAVAYRHEQPGDRDEHGILWGRAGNAPGTGVPLLGRMHPARQRQAMRLHLCQVCGQPADRTREGLLFLMTREGADADAAEDRFWPEGIRTTKPPVCSQCMPVALRLCPHLKDAVAVRSRKQRPWGVFGSGYALRLGNQLVEGPASYLPYGARDEERWFVASQAVIELTRCTEVLLGA